MFCIFLVFRESCVGFGLRADLLTFIWSVWSSGDAHIHSEWQQEWDSQPNDKLHKTYPYVHCIPLLSSQFSRRDQVVHNRLRIGHSYPTHSYLLHKEPQPLCIPCHSLFSIEEYLDFQPIPVNYST